MKLVRVNPDCSYHYPRFIYNAWGYYWLTGNNRPFELCQTDPWMPDDEDI